MAELCSGFCFAEEPRADFPAKCQLGGKDFDRDNALEPPVARFIDNPHPPSTQFGVEVVMTGENALEVRAELGIGC
jgi:hypothetical protein